MMDVIQTELRTEQPDFCMAGCTCMVEMEAEFCGKPVFFPAVRGKTDKKYGWLFLAAIWMMNKTDNL